MFDRFRDVAVEGEQPSAAGWNERTRALETVAGMRPGAGMGAFVGPGFGSWGVEGRGRPLQLVRLLADEIPAARADFPSSAPPSNVPDVDAFDLDGEDDLSDGPDVEGASGLPDAPDPDDDWWPDDVDPPDFAGDGPVEDGQDTGPPYGYNSVAQVWDEQANAWVDGQDYVTVYNPYGYPLRADDLIVAYFNTELGEWVALPLDAVQVGVTVAWPGQSAPSGVSAPPGDYYPQKATNPNVYAVSFVTPGFNRVPGSQPLSGPAAAGGPHAVVCNLGAAYVPQGTLIWLFYYCGRWYTSYGGGGGTALTVEYVGGAGAIGNVGTVALDPAYFVLTTPAPGQANISLSPASLYPDVLGTVNVNNASTILFSTGDFTTSGSGGHATVNAAGGSGTLTLTYLTDVAIDTGTCVLTKTNATINLIYANGLFKGSS